MREGNVMAEKWELVDRKKNKTGVIHERGKEDFIPKGMYHLVVEVWTKNSKGEILLTQRHPSRNYVKITPAFCRGI